MSATTGADPNGDGVSAPGEENDLVLGTENATGGSGADLLIAPGPEVNVLTGGPGGDLLDTVDGSEAADRLSCGYGADSYRADPSDTRQSCEPAVP